MTQIVTDKIWNCCGLDDWVLSFVDTIELNISIEYFLFCKGTPESSDI